MGFFDFIKSLPGKVASGVKYISGKIGDGAKYLGSKVGSVMDTVRNGVNSIANTPIIGDAFRALGSMPGASEVANTFNALDNGVRTFNKAVMGSRVD